MRHRKKGFKLGRTASQRKAMLRSLLTSLFQHKKIVTTEQKAKFARKFADKLITKAIKGDLANKRFVISFLYNREVAHNLINEIAYLYKDKPTGGYTRVIKMGERKGDGAKMAVLELVDPDVRKQSKNRYNKTKKTNLNDVAEETIVEETPVEEVATEETPVEETPVNNEEEKTEE